MNKIMRNRVFAVVAVLCMFLCGCGKENEEAATDAVETVPPQTTAVTEAPAVVQELVVESVEDQGESVVVTTSFCTVKYPFAFADLIQVKAVNEPDVASLAFSARIAETDHPLFALHFGKAEGISIGILEVTGEAGPRAVHAEFYPADEAALGNHVSTFLAAQEIFNDVVASLNDNQGFALAG